MQDLLAFPASSRIWIFQADTPLPAESIGIVNMRVREFSRAWTSHNTALKATGGLLHDKFLVLVADESHAGASGCSIDTSVRCIRQLGEEYGVDFFDRLRFSYLEDEQVKEIHRDDIREAYRNGLINDQTLFFDNLVKNKEEFLTRWLTPFGESWMKRFV